MNYSYLYLFITLFFFFATACDPNIEEPPPLSAGTADFSSYIAIGNSLTSGRVSDGIDSEMQKSTFPNLLAQQFAQVGGGEFRQPSVVGNGSGMLALEKIEFDACDGIAPTLAAKTADPNWAENISSEGPFHNLGVPFMQVATIYDTGFGSSPTNLAPTFFNRMVSEPDMNYAQMVSEAVDALQPTFFTNWLGNSDVLIFAATGGGYVDSLPPFPAVDFSVAGITPQLTSEEAFENQYNALMDTILKNGQIDGLLATIPDVTTLPFFTTLADTYLTPEEKGDSKKDTLKVLDVTDCETRHHLWYKTENDTLPVREGDLVLFLAVDYIGQPIGTNNLEFGYHRAAPLHNAYVLDAAEIRACQDATEAYNDIIRQVGEERNVPIIDMDLFFESVKNGFGVQGIPINAGFITGGMFSLDGLHPCDRGYGILANHFIDEINTIYEANVPNIDVTQFPCVVIP
ncbi:MAG: hypothetical protein ACPG5B_13240 [Chitinophagales bacterium]